MTQIRIAATLAAVVAVIAVAGCGDSQSTSQDGNPASFISAADEDLSGYWQRTERAELESSYSAPAIINTADTQFEMKSLGEGFYEYSNAVKIPANKPPVLHNGKLTRAFSTSYRMVVAPDGTLRGIGTDSKTDAMITTAWLINRDTLKIVMQDPGPDGTLVKITFSRARVGG